MILETRHPWMSVIMWIAIIAILGAIFLSYLSPAMMLGWAQMIMC